MTRHCGGLSAPSIHAEKAEVAFLSAYLGFRGADTPIEMYDARMTEQMAAKMKASDLGALAAAENAAPDDATG